MLVLVLGPCTATAGLQTAIAVAGLISTAGLLGSMQKVMTLQQTAALRQGATPVTPVDCLRQDTWQSAVPVR